MAQISTKTAELLFIALDHGIASVRPGGPMTPFVITERDESRALTRFVAETLEDSLAEAVRAVMDQPIAPGDRSVLVYDGYLTVPGSERLDAIYAEALEADGSVIVLAQRYRPQSASTDFETIGNAALIQDAAGKLRPRQ